MEPGPAIKLVLYSKLFFLMFEFIFPIGVRYVVNLRKKSQEYFCHKSITFIALIISDFVGG